MAMSCLFCDEAYLNDEYPAQVIVSDDTFVIMHPANPDELTYLGTALVVAKRHIPSFADLHPDEAAALGMLLARVARALKAVTGAGHTYTYSFGEGVHHLHIFVVARYDETPPEYVRLDVERWPAAPRGDAAAVAALCARLRAELAAG